MKTKKTLAIVMALLAALPTTLLLLLGSVYGFTVNKRFYEYEYEKNNTLAVIDTDPKTLDAMTDTIIGYLAGTREEMDLQGTIQGYTQEVFSEQAKVHMADVRSLYDLLRLALPVSAAAIVLFMLGCVAIAPKRQRLSCLCKGMLLGFGLIIAGFAVVVLYAARDFNAAFTKFQQLFFTNDLWLFDASDVLIQMLPTGFFMDIAACIAISFVSLLLILIGLCIIGVSVSGARMHRKQAAERPNADAIFSTMEIEDDSAVPDQARAILSEFANEKNQTGINAFRAEDPFSALEAEYDQWKTAQPSPVSPQHDEREETPVKPSADWKKDEPVSIPRWTNASAPAAQSAPAVQAEQAPAVQNVPAAQPEQAPVVQNVPTVQPEQAPAVQSVPVAQPEQTPIMQNVPAVQPEQTPAEAADSAQDQPKAPDTPANGAAEPTVNETVSPDGGRVTPAVVPGMPPVRPHAPSSQELRQRLKKLR